MRLDLWSFLEGSEDVLHFEGSLEYDNLNLKNRDVNIIEPIEYKGDIFKVSGDKVIDLKIKYIYSETCNRCLTSATKEIRTSLYGKLLEGKREVENEEDGYEEVLYYEKGYLSLDEYIIEQVLVSLPIKTICKDSCKGLCSECGVDLNKDNCNCVHDDIDPRLEKLKDFFSKN